MSRLTVTEAELADLNKIWTGEQLFALSNEQLRQIHSARQLVFSPDDVKRELVARIVAAQPAPSLEKTAPYSAGATAGGTNEGPVEAVNPAVVDETKAHAAARSGLTLAEIDALSDDDRNGLLAQAASDLAAKRAAEEEYDQSQFLLGSNVQPSRYELEDGKGTFLLLGDVVAEAHARSGLSVKDWNALADDVREHAIELVAAEVRNTIADNQRLRAEMEEAAKSEITDEGLTLAKLHSAVDALKDTTLHGHMDDLKSVV